jgi:hypothetical protein
MDRKTALIELRDKVNAGGALGNISGQLMADAWMDKEYFFDAYEGSLDAAKALHEAVLPNYGAGLGMPCTKEYCAELFDENDNSIFAFSDTPARAWLLAILEALIAQEEK